MAPWSLDVHQMLGINTNKIWGEGGGGYANFSSLHAPPSYVAIGFKMLPTFYRRRHRVSL